MKFAALFVLAALSLRAETGSFVIHMILHAIGEERYEITSDDSELTLSATSEYSDRGNKRTAGVKLRMAADYTPRNFETLAGANRYVIIDGGSATVREDQNSRNMAVPSPAFTIFGSSPFAVQMAMMRYWLAHGKPAKLPIVRVGSPDPIAIVLVGNDSIEVNGKTVVLDRYTVNNLAFGREVLWMNREGQLAAVMTFAAGLPLEAVRTEYESSFPQLYHAGVTQEMADLAEIGNKIRPERTGFFAIVGATLIDGTGRPPVRDSIVVISNGRIVRAGPRTVIAVPRGVPVVNAQGLTLLPGLWEMHTHFSGVEFGPALLAAGITTARDCGGEFDYLVAQRDAVEKHDAIGPRFLLAGLVDASGLKAFGHVTAETPEEGRTVVAKYHAAGFEQIKLYTFLQPEVIKAISQQAHRLGMTVTGHVPASVTTYQGIEAGMDQINHLNYVSRIVNEDSQKAIAFLKEHHTVVDPTASWGEMASHSKQVDVSTFEPGILKAPFVLDSKFRAMGSDTTADQMHTRIEQSLAVIGALHKAGIPIVPGSDTGLVGYGLQREIELYVRAGMTPMEAIQSATIVSARAMGLDRDTGTIEAGKRADLILIQGDPLTNISAIRNVSKVIANGRLFDTGALWESVGFRK